MKSTVVLAGAPETGRLDFSEKILLPEAPDRTDVVSRSSPNSPPRNNPFKAQWRQLPESLRMRPIELPKLEVNAKPQIQEVEDTSAAEFFTPSEYISQQVVVNNDVTANESQVSESTTESSEPLSEFYDHSFAIHEAVPSSQLSEISELTPGTPTYETNEEMFPETPTTGIIRSPSQRRLSQFPRPKQLSDLDDIPNARYLSSIEPQTMTVNLIVAVLSIGQPKTIMTGARFGRQHETELVEMLVGDETKTGFCITMWLPREMRVNWKDGAKAMPEGSRSLLRRSLKSTRSRDVILLQNVALSSFNGKVHGQSLRRDVTKLDLLFRRKVGDTDFGGIYSAQALRNATDTDKQALKVKRVKDWMLNFVGDTAERTSSERSRSGGRGRRRMLPPDTQ